jgi:hypothetical protein
MRVFLFAALTLCVAVRAAYAQTNADLVQAEQNADQQAEVSVSHPAFAKGTGPLIAIDSGHHNYHTLGGRYAPLAALLRNDGYRVTDSASLFTPASLANIKVLIISNALRVLPVSNEDWQRSQPSAFAPAEISILKGWVDGGGSLLLIADHLPFAGSANDLARAFGFHFADGVASRDPPGADFFTSASGTLGADVITRGRVLDEAITRLQTFAGSAFEAPHNARALITFPQGYKVHVCGLPCPPKVPERDAFGWLQGAVVTSGKGRVAVFGEAAMFSAQTIAVPGQPPFKVGFNAPSAPQNKQFVLNTLHWLSGELPP